MTLIPLFSQVQLLSSRHEAAGAPQGAVGYVIDDHGDGWYEVEFSDPSGVTLALFAAEESELRLLPDTEDGA